MRMDNNCTFENHDTEDKQIHFNITEDLNLVDGIPISKLEFDSEKHAYEQYNRYAKDVGFSIRCEYKIVNKNGIVTSRRFVCFKQGFRKEDKRYVAKNPRKQVRTGCLAHMTIALQDNGRYHVIDFEPTHNHELADESLAHILPSQRCITEVEAIEIDLADDSGIRPSLAHELMSSRVGGKEHLGFLKRDQKNYLRTKRKKDLKHGEADYAAFGDVVFFDTTFRTNKESRPLGVFIGINNHYQQVIFGASLLYDETALSFEWLFGMFFECMSDKKPITIYTDRDPAMAKALSLVPEINHRLCLWHIYQNALKNLNHVFKVSKGFSVDFNKCVYDCVYEDEFFHAWEDMLDKHELRENQWLKDLFKVKEKWALVYGRSVFSAGKKSTQLSESFNARLRDYLKSDLDVVQFFKHFERAVDNQRNTVVLANYDMSQRIPILKVNVPILRHARDIYTEAIFNVFQDEFEKSLLVVIDSQYEHGEYFDYKVRNFEETRQHLVVKSANDFITCSCKNFEYAGVICGHILKVLDELKIKTMIPEHYILKRWTKNARRGVNINFRGQAVQEDPKQAISSRYRNLSFMYVKLISKAVESKEASDYLTSHFEELDAKVEDFLKFHPLNEIRESSMADIDSKENGNTLNNNLANKINARAKGLKKRVVAQRGRNRHKSFLEKKTEKRKGKPVPKLKLSVDSSLVCPSMSSSASELLREQNSSSFNNFRLFHNSTPSFDQFLKGMENQNITTNEASYQNNEFNYIQSDGE